MSHAEMEPAFCTAYVRVKEADARHPKRRHLLAACSFALLVVGLYGLSTRGRRVAEHAVVELVATRRREVNVTLVVEAGVWHLPHGIQLHTRLYNGLAPSPTLWAAPGDRLRILLQNRLGADVPSANDALHVGFRQANTTNLHLHGIYAGATEDDTFTRVRPGEEKLYEYDLHVDSGSTLIYYHPHASGSTSLQTLGGMGGALVVLDAHQEASMGLPIAAQRVLLLQSLDLDPSSPDYALKQLANGRTSSLPWRLHNPTNFDGTLLLVNGALAGRERLACGSWLRLRLVNALVGTMATLNISFAAGAAGGRGGRVGGGCELAALALDGVWLRAPRRLPYLVLPPGGRADVLVGCTRPGLHTLASVGSVDGRGGVFAAGGMLVEIEAVYGADGDADLAALPRTLPGPPPYYTDLMDVPDGCIASRSTVAFSTPDGGNVVNGYEYVGLSAMLHQGHLLARVPRGGVAEWRLQSEEAPGTWLKLHPYHQHTTHFQIVQLELTNATDSAGATVADDRPTARRVGQTIEGLSVSVGDWRDTLPLYAAAGLTVRFIAPFEGPMMVHCHTNKHSDLGMMSIALVEPFRAAPPAAVDAVTRCTTR
jgi:FtsP/CotA-like multicopper oxidase with cupredoxin domain